MNAPIEALLRRCVIPLDKTCGPTSHEFTSWVAKLLGVKCGHSGTLDPAVSGVLLIGVGKGRKILRFLLKSEKEYVGIMRLHQSRTKEEILHKFRLFSGTITQTPPKKSHVKRIRRRRRIYELEFLEMKGRDVLFRVRCEAGTYVRKLCHDVGNALGCGAQLIELRRTRVAHISEHQCVPIQRLSDALWLYRERHDPTLLRTLLLPLEVVITLPKIVVADSAVPRICVGSPLMIPGAVWWEKCEKKSYVSLWNRKGTLIAIGEACVDSDTAFRQEKGVFVRTVRVLSECGERKKDEAKNEKSAEDEI